jgi:hypothetical protein
VGYQPCSTSATYYRQALSASEAHFPPLYARANSQNGSAQQLKRPGTKPNPFTPLPHLETEGGTGQPCGRLPSALRGRLRRGRYRPRRHNGGLAAIPSPCVVRSRRNLATTKALSAPTEAGCGPRPLREAARMAGTPGTHPARGKEFPDATVPQMSGRWWVCENHQWRP